MAAILPTALFPGFDLLAANAQAPSEGIFIPLTALEGLTSAEANEMTGDGRKVAYEIIRAIQTRYQALADNAKPQRMVCSVAPPVGLTADIVRRTYTMGFDLLISGSDVPAEP
jgi:hypothetical protein